MNTIIKNFTSIFKKFAVANLLNLLGLSLAFASFFVIMTQVRYDLGYNKSFTEHKKLFRLTMELGPGMEDYGATLPRPLVEQLSAASPHVTGYAIEQGWTNFDQFLVDEQEFSLNLVYGIRDFMSVFKPTVISGDVRAESMGQHRAAPLRSRAHLRHHRCCGQDHEIQMGGQCHLSCVRGDRGLSREQLPAWEKFYRH